MFDTLTDGAVIDGLGEASRAESAAVARRLALVGELYARRAVEWAERALWVTDPFEAVAAELSCAQNISRGRAGAQIRSACVLRDRLPGVAAVFATGVIDYRLVSTIIHRTTNVEESVIATVDAALARHAPKWMRLSRAKLIDRIDQWITKYDPAAVRVPPALDDRRYVEIGATFPGMAEVTGHVRVEAAAALDAALDALAATVCRNDPRTKDQRRADALETLSVRGDRLGCQCGAEDCPAGGEVAAPVVIHVLADAATLSGTASAPGYLPGFGIMPAQTLRDLAARAEHKSVRYPSGEKHKTVAEAQPAADETVGASTASGESPSSVTESRYRPSAQLTAFIGWRDLTCRFPGCDAIATVCDVDHTVPYPRGATHPSNVKLYCRCHHLLKTFYSGPDGWSDGQLPDGTVVITAPTGHVYTTEPHGATLFPALATPTGVAPLTPTEPARPDRAQAMPIRARTRDDDRAARITDERRRRIELDAERDHQAWLADRAQPPPF